MPTITPAELTDQLNWRYATKGFDASKKIPAETWAALQEALRLSPSSFGLQPWKFLVITDPAVKASLQPHAWGQAQTTDCSHLVVLAALKKTDEAYIDSFLDSQIAIRGGTKEALATYRGMMTGFVARMSDEQLLNWATRQVYIALGTFMTSAAVLQVDACPMEGIVPDKFDEVLGLAGGEFTTVVACAAGYRAAGDKYADLAKVRFPASQVIQSI